MMPKPVSGTYTNLENGVSVTFPSGWSGTVNEFPDIVPGEWMVFVLVMDEGRQANTAAMMQGNFATISLSIGERLDDETPEPKPPADGFDVDCSYIIGSGNFWLSKCFLCGCCWLSRCRCRNLHDSFFD